ncbi:MAG: hypothetical protein CM15mP84_03910 [Cellvibrionales bacterium]|nr:MAG: hypothetical protein CM15mP84_03910 [Cellvibrionales bacterium]
MSANGESLGRVLGVALGLCLVCSVVVSTAAVLLKPAQQANKTLDLKRNILMAAGLLDPALSVEEQFEQVETGSWISIKVALWTVSIPPL